MFSVRIQNELIDTETLKNGVSLNKIDTDDTSGSVIGPISRSRSQISMDWFSAATEMSKASMLVLLRRVSLNNRNNLLKHFPSP